MREPLRSRLYVLLGVVLGFLMYTGLIARYETDERWPSALLLLTVIVGAVTLFAGTIMQYLPGSRRRERFTVARQGFLALPTASPGLSSVLGLMTIGVLAALAVEDPDLRGFLAGAGIVLAVIVGAQAFLACRIQYVALTPDGVVWRSAWHQRLVPWHALAPGGPPPPSLLAGKLTLEVANPDAVVVRGLGVFAGTAAQPVITGQFDVHPRLMAAAIRWYVEHPDDRAAIGTAAEQTRLLAVVRAP